jgi:hypothetical protein
MLWSGPRREDEESKPMKNKQEKSDPSIVAKRPANKPDITEVDLWGSGAELAEQREGTEGNTGEQHTCRTPREPGTPFFALQGRPQQHGPPKHCEIVESGGSPFAVVRIFRRSPAFLLQKRRSPDRKRGRHLSGRTLALCDRLRYLAYRERLARH